MKKSSSQVSPKEALEFLESVRLMAEGADEPTVQISIRIPANILRAVKIQAKSENRKYQSLIVSFIRKGLYG